MTEIRDNAPGGVQFWILIIALWAVLITIAGTLAIALAIWKILEAF